MMALTKRVKQLERQAKPEQGKEQFIYGAGDWTFEEIMQLYNNPTDELIKRHNETDWPDVLTTLTIDELRWVAAQYDET